MTEERFELLLHRYRCATPMPDFRAVQPVKRTRRHWPYAAAAAAIVLVAVGIAWLIPRPRVLRDGEVVRTQRTSVRITAPSIGTIDVAPHTTLQLVDSGSGRYRLELRAGEIHAKTSSPPGVFIVDTPRATATDLGCEYTLSVGETGSGHLHVTAGWVALRYGFLQSLVPAGASAEISANGDLTPPLFDDASAAFKAAARAFERNRDDASLDAMLREARRCDALTLLNLFPRAATSDQRMRVFDRLNALVPAPPDIRRDSMHDWDINTNEHWWPAVRNASGVNAIKKPKR